jgi:hypothetical protein
MWSERFEELVLGNEAEPTAALLERLLAEVQRRARVMASGKTATLEPTPLCQPSVRQIELLIH